jgi:hypothetical protein
MKPVVTSIGIALAMCHTRQVEQEACGVDVHLAHGFLRQLDGLQEERFPLVAITSSERACASNPSRTRP